MKIAQFQFLALAIVVFLYFAGFCECPPTIPNIYLHQRQNAKLR